MALSKVTATFETSAARAADCPRDGLPEIALVGRSNVGKSSLINALVGRRVARTSAAPGKTRLVNFYRVRARNTECYLADLPGFGYARGGRQARAAFDALTAAYFSRRRHDRERAGPDGVLLLVDARHPALESDRTARRWLHELALPTTVVATKIDKLTRAERPRAVQRIQAAMDAPVVPVSAATGEGLKELWTQILAHARPAA